MDFPKKWFLLFIFIFGVKVSAKGLLLRGSLIIPKHQAPIAGLHPRSPETSEVQVEDDIKPEVMGWDGMRDGMEAYGKWKKTVELLVIRLRHCWKQKTQEFD